MEKKCGPISFYFTLGLKLIMLATELISSIVQTPGCDLPEGISLPLVFTCLLLLNYFYAWWGQNLSTLIAMMPLITYIYIYIYIYLLYICCINLNNSKIYLTRALCCTSRTV